ncbi:pilus assembly protein TadG-related protein [Caulobacter sp. NIBR2454]|uniref:pilus assembly protein TadG-related protein n=1 Tax=Caulobacter sp. NIBR2454 TaxID=3015996 RepID=UPI0022B65EDF|nr:pilus assembly protein TadG-related protein [Caulobacter sp. NIBR2454]
MAVQFAFLALPIAILCFGVLDVNRASVQKRQLQDALDAAALAAARSQSTTPEALQAAGAQALVAELAVLRDARLVSSSFVQNGPTVVASAAMDVEPIVSQLWLQGDMRVGATADVVRTLNRLEVAMVLDTTGSMGDTLNSTQTKIAALRVAANNFVTTLSAAAERSLEPDSVRIGIVPFAAMVNVGADHESAAWLDWTGAAPVSQAPFRSPPSFTPTFNNNPVNRRSLFTSLRTDWSGCVEARDAGQNLDALDTAPTSAQPATLYTPFFALDEPNLTGAQNNYRTDTLSGSSRSDWYQRQAATNKYGGSPSGGQGPNAGCGMRPITPLTNEWDDLHDAIDDLNASGLTNIPMGLMWGWNLVSPNGPVQGPQPTRAYGAERNTKIIVLMTDGDNTYSRITDGYNGSARGAYGYIWEGRLPGVTAGSYTASDSTRVTAMNNRMTLLCNNIRAQGIRVYSIGVGVSTNTRTLLRNCATSADMYYDVTGAAQMNAAFNAIAGSIDNLRIAR